MHRAHQTWVHRRGRRAKVRDRHAAVHTAGAFSRVVADPAPGPSWASRVPAARSPPRPAHSAPMDAGAGWISSAPSCAMELQSMTQMTTAASSAWRGAICAGTTASRDQGGGAFRTCREASREWFRFVFFSPARRRALAAGAGRNLSRLVSDEVAKGAVHGRRKRPSSGSRHLVRSLPAGPDDAARRGAHTHSSLLRGHCSAAAATRPPLDSLAQRISSFEARDMPPCTTTAGTWTQHSQQQRCPCGGRSAGGMPLVARRLVAAVTLVCCPGQPSSCSSSSCSSSSSSSPPAGQSHACQATLLRAAPPLLTAAQATR